MAVTSHRRRARRSTLVACSGLLLALATSASASAAEYSVSSYDGGGSYGGSVNGAVTGAPDEVTGPVRMVIMRAGSVVADNTGTHVVNNGVAYASTDSGFDAQAGDTVKLFYPATETIPVRSVSYTHLTLPTILLV